MPLIDHTYFVDELKIPNADSPDIQASLIRFIAKYQEKFLRELFGSPLYVEFTTGIAVDPIESLWSDVVDLLVNEGAKTSPIANYVYYHWQLNEATQSTGVGEVINKTDNGQRTTPG